MYLKKNPHPAKLDVSANTKLVSLYCDGYQLLELDISANAALTDLCCSTVTPGIASDVDIKFLRLLTGEALKYYVDSLVFVQ